MQVTAKLNTNTLDFLLFALLAFLSGSIAVALGQDANWDLLNYHFYNPYALLNGRTGHVDLAPAQLQTYLNPLFDLPSYFILKTIENPKVATFFIGSISGIGLFFLYKICNLVLLSEFDFTSKRLFAPIVILVGLSGSTAISTLGTTFTEWISASLILCSLYYFLKFIKFKDKNSYLMLASFIVGIAIGGKLTNAIFFIGFIFALLLSDIEKLVKIKAILIYLAFSFIGIIISIGYWSLFLYSNFDSPIFPFYNQYFLSPWFEPLAIAESGIRYLPKSVSQWLFYPYYWGLIENNTVAEVTFRDPRIFSVFFLLIIYLTYNLLNYINYKLTEKISNSTFFILIFFFSSYFVWLIKFSIYRYILPLELLCPIVILAIIVKILKNKKISAILFLTIAIFIAYYTKPMQWGRIGFGDTFFKKDTLPVIPNNSLLIFFGDDPMSYVIPLMNKSILAAGIENNLIKYGQKNKLLDSIKERIASHTSDSYLVSSIQREGEVDAKLEKYNLYRMMNTCSIFRSNVGAPLHFCKLTTSVSESLKSKSQAVELLKNINLSSQLFWSHFSSVAVDSNFYYVTVNDKEPVIQTIEVEPDSKYVNSLSIRCHNENTQGRLQVNWLDSNKKFISSSGSAYNCTQNWSRYSEIVFSPPGSKYADIYISGHSNKFIDAYNPSFKK